MKKLLHWWRMLVEPSGAGRLTVFQPKRWYVEYPPDEKMSFPGGKSVPMAYDSACNLAAIHGGKVKRYKPTKEMG